jgi:hypothetical protein
MSKSGQTRQVNLTPVISKDTVCSDIASAARHSAKDMNMHVYCLGKSEKGFRELMSSGESGQQAIMVDYSLI